MFSLAYFDLLQSPVSFVLVTCYLRGSFNMTIPRLLQQSEICEGTLDKTFTCDLIQFLYSLF